MTVQAKVTSYQLLTRDSRPVGPVPVNAPVNPPPLYEQAAGDAAAVAAGNSEITFDRLAVNTLRTPNYDEEDGSKGSGKPVGTPLHGAKLDTEGTALKVASDNVQIGTYTLTDAFFRALNALVNYGTSSVWYRGSVNTGVRGGAPDTTSFTVTPSILAAVGTATLVRLDIGYRPDANGNNNLESMRFAYLKLYSQSALGTGAGITLTLRGDGYAACGDRLYRDPTSDTYVLNRFSFTHTMLVNGTITYPAVIAQLWNAFGGGPGHCFYAPAGWGAGNPLTDNGSSWPAGWGGTPPAPPPPDGGGDPGSACCAPWTPVRMADGSWRAAADLRVGDAVLTRPEGSSLYGAYLVTAASVHDSERWAVISEDGRPFLFSPNHRVLVLDGTFKRVRELAPGDVLSGPTPARVVQVGPLDHGPVVKLTVDRAHTYDSMGIISHNLKQL